MVKGWMDGRYTLVDALWLIYYILLHKEKSQHKWQTASW